MGSWLHLLSILWEMNVLKYSVCETHPHIFFGRHVHKV